MKNRLSGISSGFILIVLAAFAGMVLTAWSTRLGPGVGGDATIYLASAQNLARGIGLGLVQADGTFRLLPYSAPLFPLILTPFSYAGFNLTPIARWMNIQLFGVLIFLVGFFSLRVSKEKRIGAIPAWLLAFSPILLPVYSWAMAEPITLAFGFGGLVLILWNLQKADLGHHGWIIFAGLLLGLSFAARYSAAAFLAAGVLMCLFWQAGPFRRRFLTAIQLGFVGILPAGIWILVQLSQTASVSSRSFLTFSEMTGRLTAFWPQLNTALLVWLVPASFLDSAPYPVWINQVLPVSMFITMLGITAWMANKNKPAFYFRLVKSLWMFSGLYILVILLVYLTTYPPITIDNRMLSPLHMSITWIAGLLLTELIIQNPGRICKIAISMIAIGFIGWYGIRTVRIALQNADTGLGYNATVWQQSPLMDRVKDLDGDAKLITNEAMAVLYLTGRTAWPVAEIYFNEQVKNFYRYGDGRTGVDSAEGEFRAGGGYLVLFNSLESQLEPIYGDLASERAKSLTNGLLIVVSSSDGAIFQYPEQKADSL